jgi:hypothetical protein
MAENMDDFGIARSLKPLSIKGNERPVVCMKFLRFIFERI